ncbi:lipid A 3-O-deacylase domain protein [Burkholderia multivorans ATCC BAA-247]|nr:lipid A 3-O-deacylase domain protein [Burkholderia multivorans ATCC BAA-247]
MPRSRPPCSPDRGWLSPTAGASRRAAASRIATVSTRPIWPWCGIPAGTGGKSADGTSRSCWKAMSVTGIRAATFTAISANSARRRCSASSRAPARSGRSSEAGAGVRLLTHPTISDNFSMSTAFQFADVVGVGAQFGERQQYQVGYRFQHVSNAGIKEPNPGVNFHQFYVQYNF